MEQLRDKGVVPLGVISYNFTDEKLELSVFQGVNTEEVNALFERLGLRVGFK